LIKGSGVANEFLLWRSKLGTIFEALVVSMDQYVAR
jgi:hypothetical protein